MKFEFLSVTSRKVSSRTPGTLGRSKSIRSEFGIRKSFRVVNFEVRYLSIITIEFEFEFLSKIERSYPRTGKVSRNWW